MLILKKQVRGDYNSLAFLLCFFVVVKNMYFFALIKQNFLLKKSSKNLTVPKMLYITFSILGTTSSSIRFLSKKYLFKEKKNHLFSSLFFIFLYSFLLFYGVELCMIQ